MDDDRGLPDGTLSIEGSWSLQPPGHDPRGPATTVRFTIDTVGGQPRIGTRTLSVLDDGGGLVLATPSSDPSIIEQIVYHRAGS